MAEEARDQLESQSLENGDQEEQVQEQETPEPDEEESEADNGPAQKRGRMITAAVVVVVVLAFVVVVVAGIFQWQERGSIKSDADQGANDPAPILWKDIVSKKAVPAPLGVTKAASKQSYLKERSPESK